MSTGGVRVAGPIEVSNGSAILTSSGSITAGDRTAKISLPGKGELRLCSTTTIHLSRDRSASAALAASALSAAASSQAPALMIALDRGALEAAYTTGRYSDVLMTPDFRILISGPGQADLRIRVSPQGDTCIENRGDHAPYVTVSSQLEEGLYRVQSGQRVLFEHGSLREVVDHEQEPCGCPPPPMLTAAGEGAASATTSPGSAAVAAPVTPGPPKDGATRPRGSAADSSFPLAVSEGLAPIPQPAPESVPPGQIQTQVTVPLIYNGATAQNGPATPPAPPNHTALSTGSGTAPASSSSEAQDSAGPGGSASRASAPSQGSGPASPQSAQASAPSNLPTSPFPSQPIAAQPAATPKPAPSGSLFHRIGRFFSRLFGGSPGR
ncbi:MAG TPA: hypothetical protein VGD59_11630 [Acidisarcina sp.]